MTKLLVPDKLYQRAAGEICSTLTQPWSPAPSGGDAWRAYEQLPLAAAPSGAQYFLYSVAAPGGLMVTVAFSGALVGGEPAGARWPYLRSLVASLSLPKPTRKRADNDGGSESSAGAALSVISADVQLDVIQEALSLSVSQIAEILRVSRPTVYAWARGRVIIPRDPADVARLRALFRASQSWQALSEFEMGRFVSLPLGDGQPNLFQLFNADTWDEDKIAHAMRLIAERLKTRAAERGASRDHAGGHTSPEQTAIERERLRALSRRTRYHAR